ncbi:hypothetical protein [Massilia sp. Dwa41.01b]|uniref:hypothetical protein n=1 Tax=Massilia sp. Dwa41.01b TaxID=2709302 RepID=UPI001E2F5A83|nr:hypothetical protein [Massilia sp. Dwa41.01b]
MAADRRGALWLGTSEGPETFRPCHWCLQHTAPARWRQRRCRQGTRLRCPGTLWIGGAGGIGRLAPGATRIAYLPAPSDPRRSRILALSMGPRDTLWVGSEAGLEAWNVATPQPERRAVTAAEGLGEVRVLALYHDPGARSGLAPISTASSGATLPAAISFPTAASRSTAPRCRTTRSWRCALTVPARSGPVPASAA